MVSNDNKIRHGKQFLQFTAEGVLTRASCEMYHLDILFNYCHGGTHTLSVQTAG